MPEPAGYGEGHFLSYSPRPAARLWRITVQREGKQQWRQHLRLLQEQLQARGLATLHRTLPAVPLRPPAFLATTASTATTATTASTASTASTAFPAPLLPPLPPLGPGPHPTALTALA